MAGDASRWPSGFISKFTSKFISIRIFRCCTTFSLRMGFLYPLNSCGALLQRRRRHCLDSNIISSSSTVVRSIVCTSPSNKIVSFVIGLVVIGPLSLYSSSEASISSVISFIVHAVAFGVRLPKGLLLHCQSVDPRHLMHN